MADVPRVVFPSLSPLEECTPDTLPCTHPDFRRGVWLASMSKEEADETHRVTVEVFDVVQRLLKQNPPSLTTTSANTPSYSTSTFPQEPPRYDPHHFDATLKPMYHIDYHSNTYQYLYYAGDSHSGSWRLLPRRSTAPSVSPVTPFEDEALLSFHPHSMPATTQQRTGFWLQPADGDPHRHGLSFPDCYYTCPESAEAPPFCDDLPSSVWAATEDSCQLSSTNALGLVF